MKALGESATDLLWLAPGVSTLVALTRAQGPSAWHQVRVDPGAVLLLARVWGRDPHPETASFSQLVDEPAVLDMAQEFLARADHCAVDWAAPGAQLVYRQSLCTAKLSQRLAECVPGCDVERAWGAGLLSALGWQALCADASSKNLLAELEQLGRPPGWLKKESFDATALTRRLARRWALPDWLTNILGNLALPAEIACRLGAPRKLFQIVQLALNLYQQELPNLQLTVGAGFNELCKDLGLDPDEVGQFALEILRQRDAQPALGPSMDEFPWLGDLLKQAFSQRGAAPASLAERLHDDVERIHHALEHRLRCEADTLQAMKLASLGELAAGAGHEINNPLAVISGQAQYAQKQLAEAESLVVEEPELAELFETFRGKIDHALDTIVGQTRRIYQVLCDLMQFARPNPVHAERISMAELVSEALESQHELASVHGVRLESAGIPDDWQLDADPVQLRRALQCLLQNAIEAAPRDGWASVRVERNSSKLTIVIEDNGQGPPPAGLPHLFDPFYCGRSAGRGRGLGLSTAWRLIRQHGGDVQYAGRIDDITRFVLILPASRFHTNSANGPHYRTDEDLLISEAS